MLLAIDIGNTNTKLGYFNASGKLVGNWRVTTARARTSDEYGVLFQGFFSSAHFELDHVDAIVVASVVPQVDRWLFEACEKYFQRAPVQFTAATQKLIEVKTDRPLELGADLAAGAIGAVAIHGSPVIVINFGTATTFSAVGDKGAFLGAVIAPGIQISIDALATRTAKLPQIALAAPASAIGRDTVSALQSGIVYGAVGQTEGMVARLRAEMGGSPKVVATGGLADIVAAETKIIDVVEPHLVLEGLRRYYDTIR
jgi:type III pantothenate kinase